MANIRKTMELKNIWFHKNEFNKLLDAIEGNEKDEAFDILFAIKKRGDL